MKEKQKQQKKAEAVKKKKRKQNFLEINKNIVNEASELAKTIRGKHDCDHMKEDDTLSIGSKRSKQSYQMKQSKSSKNLI